MKTKSITLVATLLAAFSLFSTNSNAADKNDKNLILKPVSSLSVGALDPENSDKVNPEESNIWIYRVAPELRVGDVTVELDNALNRNVFHCKFDEQKSWYGTYLTYRTKERDFKRGVYTLSFKVKGSGNNIKCIIIGNGGKECVTAAKKNAKATPSGYNQFRLRKDYTEVSLDFDFSKTVKSPYDFPNGDGELKESSDEILKNFFIIFAPTGNETEFYLDDIVLAPKQQQ